MGGSVRGDGGVCVAGRAILPPYPFIASPSLHGGSTPPLPMQPSKGRIRVAPNATLKVAWGFSYPPSHATFCAAGRRAGVEV